MADLTTSKGVVDVSAAAENLSSAEMLVLNPGSMEDFFPAVTISVLMRILRDPSLQQHHNAVIQPIVFIFKSLGVKCVPHVQQVSLVLRKGRVCAVIVPADY